MSMSLAYSSFFDAARIREGFVVASSGLYWPMAAKSQYGWKGMMSWVARIVAFKG
jgi:hypothetical protein